MCWIKMKPLLIFLATVSFVSCDVKEVNSSYACCGKPSLPFNYKCELTWNIDDQTIAHFKTSARGCIAPCLIIHDGLLTLSHCVAVNCTKICTNDNIITSEERIHFLPQRCSGSSAGPRNPHGSGFSALAGFLIGILLIFGQV